VEPARSTDLEDLDSVGLGGLVEGGSIELDGFLRKLYAQAQQSSWSVDDVCWDEAPSVDLVVPRRAKCPRVPRFHPWADWDLDAWQEYDLAILRYTLSQSFYAEQLGVFIGANIATRSDNWDLRMFAVSQTADEARHADVFRMYLNRSGGVGACGSPLREVIDVVSASPEWDKSQLLMSTVIEGVALSAYSMTQTLTADPVLKQILSLILSDEARHVAFDIHVLKNVHNELSATELQERSELVIWCLDKINEMNDAALVSEEFGLDVREMRRMFSMSPERRSFDLQRFSHLRPLFARVGLLDANDGWLDQQLQLRGIEARSTDKV
jgi:hypothetical protein